MRATDVDDVDVRVGMSKQVEHTRWEIFGISKVCERVCHEMNSQLTWWAGPWLVGEMRYAMPRTR